MIHLKLAQFKKLAAKFKSGPLELAGADSFKEIEDILKELTGRGYAVSIYYGPCGQRGIFYQVALLGSSNRMEFSLEGPSLKELLRITWRETKRGGKMAI